MDGVFNEACLGNPANDVLEARRRMSAMFATVRALRRVGFEGVVHTIKGIQSVEIAPGYRIADWLKDPDVLRDEQERIRALWGGTPYVPALYSESELESGTLVEYQHAGTPVYGLGLADLWDTFALSVAGDSRFEIDPVVVTRYVVTAGGSSHGAEEVDICNLTFKEDVVAREPWILSRLTKGLEDGHDLWERRNELFPHLTFCGRTRQQITQIQGGSAVFKQVFQHLRVLNATTRDWDGGVFQPVGIRSSSESRPTLEHRVHGPKRDFSTPSGVFRFSDHTKMIGLNMRIYYMPHPGSTYTTYVAYVGPHLSTVDYPT